MFIRPIYAQIETRLRETPRRIQILAGPRQVGKTTLVTQLLERRSVQSAAFVSADLQTPPVLSYAMPIGLTSAALPGAPADTRWLEEHWNQAMVLAAQWAQSGTDVPFVFIVDEIQNIPNWSAAVKGLWDKSLALKTPMQVVLLGSAPLLINRGLSDSLAGRYEQLRMTHWSFEEMNGAFDFDLDQYIYFGGFPGSGTDIGDEPRWRDYINGSLIYPNLERDILQMVRVGKPALLKQLFLLACAHSGQIVALTKFLGQLDDAGNVTTLARYLDLLQQAGLVAGLQKYATKEIRKRNSVPKFHALNTAFISATIGRTFLEARGDRTYWGHLVESAIGAHLINGARDGTEIFYWREGNFEVDFVICRAGKIALIEVKSGKLRNATRGMSEFIRRNGACRSLVVGPGAIEIGEFLRYPPEHWVE